MSAGGLKPVGSPAFTDEESARFHAAGWWSGSTLSDAVRRNAERTPERHAYVDHGGPAFIWREFDTTATSLTETLAGIGVARGVLVLVGARPARVWGGAGGVARAAAIEADDAAAASPDGVHRQGAAGSRRRGRHDRRRGAGGRRGAGRETHRDDERGHTTAQRGSRLGARGAHRAEQ
ncbi:hypothetical protein [Mycobacterium sp. 1245499.0]|uniref:hypothetical protein n=1 Tax=Mycobacterium sp. 1245499.0 TaxID=1834074 RepID=UPI003510664D